MHPASHAALVALSAIVATSMIEAMPGRQETPNPYVGRWTCRLAQGDITLTFAQEQNQLRVSSPGLPLTVVPTAPAEWLRQGAAQCGGQCDLLVMNRQGGYAEPWLMLARPVNGQVRAAWYSTDGIKAVTCSRASATLELPPSRDVPAARAGMPGVDAAERKLADLQRAKATPVAIQAARDERLATWITARLWEQAGTEVSTLASGWAEARRRLSEDSKAAFAAAGAGTATATQGRRPLDLNNVGVALAEEGWFKSAFAAFNTANELSRGQEGPSAFQQVVLWPNIQRLPPSAIGTYFRQAGSNTARSLLFNQDTVEYDPSAVAVYLGAFMPSIVSAALATTGPRIDGTTMVQGFWHPLLGLKGVTTAILAWQKQFGRGIARGRSESGSSNRPRFDRDPNPIPLSPGTVVVDLYWHAPPRGSAMHLLAFIGTNERTVRADLGEATPIIESVSAWREAASRRTGTPSEVNEKWQRIAALLWAPLQKHVALSRVTEIIVIPDQYLDELPWAGFGASATAPIRVVDAPRDLLTRSGSAATTRTVVVEDVDYGTGAGRRARLPGGELTAADCATFKIDCSTRLSGERATRPALTAAVRGASLVHVDTHGETVPLQAIESGWQHWPWIVYPLQAVIRDAFSLQGLRREALGSIQAALGVAPRAPATSTYLALSGANRRAASPPHENDGTVTDMEIAALDFSSADLVVFSACESGRQLRVAYQGLVSLRSAVQAAGARSVLMTVWQVDARATTLVMREFYRQHLGLNKRKSVALRLAQETVQAIPEFAHPYFWAGWILVGADDDR